METKPSDPGTTLQSELPFSPKTLPRSSSRHVGQETFDSLRGGDTIAVPASPPSSALSPACALPLQIADAPLSRSETLARVLGEVRAIERRDSHTPKDRTCVLARDQSTKAWGLGVPQIDQQLGPKGLDTSALHEIKPTLEKDGPEGAACNIAGSARRSGGAGTSDWASAFTAALCFAMALHIRRRITCVTQAAPAARLPLLWCWSSALAQEIGQLHPAGLSGFGLDSTELIIVTPDKPSDVLWTMEEGLKSGSVALVIGVLREVELTPARRLALAASTTATPCLLVTDPQAAVAAATATRWRIGRALSARHPFAGKLGEVLPGAPRYGVTLERCRSGGLAGSFSPLVLEWSDATNRFCLASSSVDRAYPEIESRSHRR